MIARYVCVTCDRCGAPAGDTSDMRDDAREARIRARQLGFVRRNAGLGVPKREDLCPTCSKASEGRGP